MVGIALSCDGDGGVRLCQHRALLLEWRWPLFCRPAQALPRGRLWAAAASPVTRTRRPRQLFHWLRLSELFPGSGLASVPLWSAPAAGSWVARVASVSGPRVGRILGPGRRSPPALEFRLSRCASVFQPLRKPRVLFPRWPEHALAKVRAQLSVYPRGWVLGCATDRVLTLVQRRWGRRDDVDRGGWGAL